MDEVIKKHFEEEGTWPDRFGGFETQTFTNGNVTLKLPRRERTRIEKLKTEDEKQRETLGLILNVLDFKADLLPVTGKLEKIREMRKKTETQHDGWRLFSFQTLREYHMTEDDVCDALMGKTLRLRARTATQDVYDAMLWEGFDVKAALCN